MTDLRSRLTFARRVEVTDAYGNTTGAWEDQFSVAADIRPRLGGETVEAARLTGRQPVVLRVRQSIATRQIKTDWKATNPRNGVEYNIRTVVDPREEDADHGHWFDMLAEAGVAI